ncbi:hypothetical protein [Sphingomonas sp. G-3-2-10]|uniref:hypothetical protein n=1 Tax=Sphingomonas sp. G-3-2-10 TaxID=2728838 RepID=UPI00146DB71E|nr:hypothetical protein [Sphingomonas sp. G-3-2-10]NML04324.1 hypothetical protein [Sphingomonas sp. G-3-2-10]
MRDDLDDMLGRLAAQPPHPGLDAVSMAVLDQISAPRPRRENFAVTSTIAAVLAVGMGVAGGWSSAAQAQQISTFDDSWELAPSTLLGGG